MAGVAIGSWLAVSATGGDRVNPEGFFGMIRPLFPVCLSWLAVQRTHRVAPERVMGALIIGFGLKFVFFGAYVAVMLGLWPLRPVPFMTAFVSYFIALYAMQALFVWRLITSV